MTYDNMPASSPHTISLAQFRQLFPSSSCIGIRDDFCVMDLRYDDRLDILNHPCRFDGYLVFFCISGRLEMTINLKEFEVAENSLFINIPGNIIQITGIESSQKDQIRFLVMAMTGEFMSDLKMDIGKLIEKGTLCKMARGEMVRYLAENQAETPVALRSFDRLGYRYSKERSDETTYTFLHVDSE